MKEDIKYPYIGKANLDGALVVFYSEAYGRCFRSDSWGCGVRGDYNEKAFTNITHEYLSNTWGVVESKEHAEFIIELAELHGLVYAGDITDKARAKCFMIYGNKLELYPFCHRKLSNEEDKKQITIPLPPKAKDWPQVGDAVTWGNKVCNGVVKAFDGNLAWIKNDHANYVTEYIDNLVKPKSKQDLLIEELQTKLCKNNAVDNYILACDIINGEIEGLSYEGE